MPSHCTLHCARRCRLLGARVGALSSRYDAAASGAHRAGLLRARRGYLVAWTVSAAAARLLWSTSGPKVPAGASAGGARLTPGGEGRRFRARDRCWACGGPRQQRSPAAPPSRGVVQEPPQAPSRPRASPQAPPTPVHKLPRRMEMPLEPPTPAWARGFASEWVAPRRWPEALGSRRGCLGTFSAHRSLGSGRPTVPRCFLGDMRLLRRFRGRFCLVGLLRCLSPLLGQVQKFRNGRISQYFRKGALSTQNSQ